MSPEVKKQDQDNSPPNNKSRYRPSKKLTVILGIIIMLLVIPVAYMGYLYVSSPAVIRGPKQEHYHFRMQILVNGKAEDFSAKKYQTGYSKDNCSANLTELPIHFHDNKDQFTHIHWEGMTGGMVMKYYGWNYIGGMNGALGYKVDDLSDIQKVNIHGNMLPAVPKDATFFIYTGSEKGYKQRSLDDWKRQDLEQFFGVTSNFPGHTLNKNGGDPLSSVLFPTASANSASGPGQATRPNETEQERLTRINNLIGNVVIFVQKDQPTQQQIKDRFNNLAPLSDSSCGG